MYNGGIVMDNYPNSEWDNMIIIMGYRIIMIPFQQVSRTPMSTMKQWVFDTAQDFIFEKWYKMMQTCVTLTPPWDL